MSEFNPKGGESNVLEEEESTQFLILVGSKTTDVYNMDEHELIEKPQHCDKKMSEADKHLKFNFF